MKGLPGGMDLSFSAVQLGPSKPRVATPESLIVPHTVLGKWFPGSWQRLAGLSTRHVWQFGPLVSSSMAACFKLCGSVACTSGW